MVFVERLQRIGDRVLVVPRFRDENGQSDIIFSIKRLEKAYSFYCEKSRERYSYISDRQKEDLKGLVSYIINGE